MSVIIEGNHHVVFSHHQHHHPPRLIIIIIIIIIIYCDWVVTRWQWLFYMYTKHEIGYY